MFVLLWHQPGALVWLSQTFTGPRVGHSRYFNHVRMRNVRRERLCSTPLFLSSFLDPQGSAGVLSWIGMAYLPFPCSRLHSVPGVHYQVKSRGNVMGHESKCGEGYRTLSYMTFVGCSKAYQDRRTRTTLTEGCEPIRQFKPYSLRGARGDFDTRCEPANITSPAPDQIRV